MDHSIACVGTLLLGNDGEFIHSCAKFPSLKSIFCQLLNQYTSLIGWDISGYNLNLKEVHFPKVVDYITGADLFIRRDVVEQLGLFNPLFFMYYEETEMQYRYRSMGYFSVLINTPKILHLNGIKKKKRNPFFRRRRKEGFLYGQLSKRKLTRTSSSDWSPAGCPGRRRPGAAPRGFWRPWGRRPAAPPGR